MGGKRGVENYREEKTKRKKGGEELEAEDMNAEKVIEKKTKKGGSENNCKITCLRRGICMPF